MARLNVYLPDDLAAAARRANLNVSALTQDAVRAALTARSTNSWLDSLRSARTGVSHDQALEALDAIRDEGSTRHG